MSTHMTHAAPEAGISPAASSNREAGSPENWPRAISRFSIVAMFIPLLLPVVLLFGMRFQPGDLAQGAAFRELLQASRSPGWYRVLMVLDVAIWLAFAATLLLLSGLVRRHTPIRSALIQWCSAGMCIGIVTGLLRLAVIGPLAAKYATDFVARLEVLQTFSGARALLDLPSQAGIVFGCIGYALAATSLWALRAFPRWLAVWVGVPSAGSLVQLILIFLGHGFFLPLVVVNNIVGFSGLCAAMAVAMPRREAQLLRDV